MIKNQIIQDTIYLVSCAVNDRQPDRDRVESMDLAEVYALAARHMVSAIVAFALERAEYKDAQSGRSLAVALSRATQFDKAWEEIKVQLIDAGIWYMPLKGAVLKGLYPKYGMREFADHDILFDVSRSEDVRTIMEELGFKTEHFGTGNHDCYHKMPCLNFEMHRSLFGSGHDERLYTYYQHVEDRLLGDGCEKHFTSEDFYVYMIAHEYKHYANAGTGLRSLLDTYVYLRATELDIDYVAAETEKLGMVEFESANRLLAQHLFSGQELTEADEEMLEYVMSSGVYGTIGNRVENTMAKNGYGKLRYALDRFFVPVSKNDRRYESFAAMYPIFYEHKVLLPLLPFYRTLRAMKAGRFNAEARAIRDAKAQPPV